MIINEYNVILHINLPKDNININRVLSMDLELYEVGFRQRELTGTNQSLASSDSSSNLPSWSAVATGFSAVIRPFARALSKGKEAD